MKKKRILIVSGTRPDTIKLAPLVKKFQNNQNFKTTYLVTGQHKDLLNQALEVFDLKPDINLKVMRHNQTLTGTHARILNSLEKSLDPKEYDLIITHGDTLTGYTLSLWGFYNNIEVAHVEAGLRTYDLKNPYPEEGLRQQIDIVTTHLFPPTQLAKQNLLKETKNNKNIYVTGNTVVDAVKLITKNRHEFQSKELKKIDFENKKIVLVTLHRRENFGNDMKQIFSALKKLVQNHKDIEIIYPVHLNPKVREPAEKFLGKTDRISLIPPIVYPDMLNLIRKSYMVITDSGGIQEEAPSFNKPVLVARHVTERPEGVKSGILKIVGTNTENIYKEAEKLLVDEKYYRKIKSIKNPYGDGKASDRIVSYFENYFKIKSTKIKEFN